MKRKFLEDLGLTKEQIDSIMAVNGEDIEKAKGDLADVKAQLETANNTIKERDTQLEELKKVDAKALQDEITKLQEANKTAQKEHEKQLADMKLTTALKLGITDAQDIDLVIGQLDREKISLGEDGKVVGLEEQLKTLRESKGFLFKQEPQIKSPFRLSNSNTGNQGMTRADFLKMPYSKRMELYNSNPALYQKLLDE